MSVDGGFSSSSASVPLRLHAGSSTFSSASSTPLFFFYSCGNTPLFFFYFCPFPELSSIDPMEEMSQKLPHACMSRLSCDRIGFGRALQWGVRACLLPSSLNLPPSTPWRKCLGTYKTRASVLCRREVAFSSRGAQSRLCPPASMAIKRRLCALAF